MAELYSRRDMLSLGGALGLAVLWPSSTGCAAAPGPRAAAPSPLDVPRAKPSDWDPIAFNRARGNAGAIPASYLPKVNGPDGATQHIGKHLPYVAKIEGVPTGTLPLMWGDPSRGYAKHPNAPKSDKLPSGHWFEWIRVRPATEGDAEERESRFSSWPKTSDGDNGRLAGQAGSEPSAEDGKKTVYVVELPSGIKAGDWVRVHGHCLTHGEYVDFVQVPA